MFDAKRLLGDMLGGVADGALGSKHHKHKKHKKSSLIDGLLPAGILPGKAAIGMGILGVAIAAFEHFTSRPAAYPAQYPAQYPAAAPQVPPPLSPSSPPPPPPGSAPLTSAGPAPGLPSGAYGTTRAIPAANAGASFGLPPVAPPPSASAADPVLLIRAMIAAAHADGIMDATERERISSQLQRSTLDDDERAFLEREFASPRTRREIAADVASPQAAAEVYAVSLLAVDVDTDAEHDYLEGLRISLGIEPALAEAIRNRVSG